MGRLLGKMHVKIIFRWGAIIKQKRLINTVSNILQNPGHQASGLCLGEDCSEEFQRWVGRVSQSVRRAPLESTVGIVKGIHWL